MKIVQTAAKSLSLQSKIKYLEKSKAIERNWT